VAWRLGVNKMIRKARENLDCAKTLVLDQYAYYDAAANRAYYAAYHAAWHHLTQTGHTVPTKNRGAYWPHERISDILEDTGACPYPDWDADWDYLWSQRIKADYRVDNVTKGAARKVLEHAEQIVAWVTENEAR
jgi:uncharacterized protein (UPF0332 family)